MVYFNHIVHAYACQHCLTTVSRNSLFDGKGFAEHQFSWPWSVSEIGHNP